LFPSEAEIAVYSVAFQTERTIKALCGAPEKCGYVGDRALRRRTEASKRYHKIEYWCRINHEASDMAFRVVNQQLSFVERAEVDEVVAGVADVGVEARGRVYAAGDACSFWPTWKIRISQARQWHAKHVTRNTRVTSRRLLGNLRNHVLAAAVVYTLNAASGSTAAPTNHRTGGVLRGRKKGSPMHAVT
jgi:hypothetical protein